MSRRQCNNAAADNDCIVIHRKSLAFISFCRLEEIRQSSFWFRWRAFQKAGKVVAKNSFPATRQWFLLPVCRPRNFFRAPEGIPLSCPAPAARVNSTSVLHLQISTLLQTFCRRCVALHIPKVA